MSMTNVIKENNFIIYMLNIDDFKDELDALDKFDWKEKEYIEHSFDPNIQPIDDPDAELEFIKKRSFGNQPTPGKLTNRNIFRCRKKDDKLDNIIQSILNKLEKHFKQRGIHLRGIYSYPPGGVCNWHTNSNGVGKRIYFTWAEEDNKSFFKYFDNETNQIITRYDKKGWFINEFEIPTKGLLWHYIGCDTYLKSIGFLIPI